MNFVIFCNCFSAIHEFNKKETFILQKEWTFNKFLLLIVVLFASPDPTSSSGSNKTDLATGRGSSLDSRCFANMLMVTTTVGMLYGVHSHTTNLGPAVALNLKLMVGTSSLQHGLVNTATTGNDTDHGSVGRRDHLSDEQIFFSKSNFRRFNSALVTFLVPEGNLTLVLLVSGLWAMTVA